MEVCRGGECLDSQFLELFVVDQAGLSAGGGILILFYLNFMVSSYPILFAIFEQNSIFSMNILLRRVEFGSNLFVVI